METTQFTEEIFNAARKSRDESFKKFESDTLDFGVCSRESADSRAAYRAADAEFTRVRRLDPEYISLDDRLLGAIFGE